jgi:UDP-glucosyl transferase 73C
LEHVEDENELINFPGFPTPLQLTKEKCPGSLSVYGLEQIRKNIYEEEIRSSGVVMNSFQELEALYIESFEQITGKKVWTLGPMCLCNQDINAMAARGNKASMDEAQCLRWLDLMKPGSVTFVSFGSLACTAPRQLVELGLGLEASKKPFVWVIKAGDKFPQVEEWLAEGFEERVKDKAIGGFMTHCGWNSTIEGICAGIPMITWPHFAEQFVNERLVVDVLKTGVEVGVKAVTQWGQEQTEVTVTRDAVEKAVSKLMDDGEAAEEMRMKAKEFGVKARKALEEGGSSYNNINLLIQEMGNQANASG